MTNGLTAHARVTAATKRKRQLQVGMGYASGPHARVQAARTFAEAELAALTDPQQVHQQANALSKLLVTAGTAMSGSGR